MKIFVQQLGDEFETKQRAKHLLAACREFGAEPTGESGDSFSVKFAPGTSRAQVGQFLEAVGARGVTLEKTDSSALAGDPTFAATLDAAISRKDIATERLLVEDLFDTVDSAAGPDVNAMTEAQKDEMFHAIQVQRGEIENGDIYARRPEASAEDFGAGELDAQLEKFQKSGEAARWHRQRGF